MDYNYENLEKTFNDNELSPNRILRIIVDSNHINYVYIILGRSGTTGKTWLYNALKHYGFNTFEISEDIYNLVGYYDNENHVIIDDYNRKVTIVLNRPLK